LQTLVEFDLTGVAEPVRAIPLARSWMCSANQHIAPGWAHTGGSLKQAQVAVCLSGIAGNELQSHLNAGALAAAWPKGQAMSAEEAIACALNTGKSA
jgi:hypothetical protein